MIAAIFRLPWFWSWFGAVLMVVAIIAVSGGAAGAGVVSAALLFGSFFVIVAIGQMLVITTGPGNVDLSIPSSMTLVATVAMKVMDGSDGMILVGLLLALVLGILIGSANYLVIRLLNIPPIIATLSTSFIYQSLAIWYNRGLRIKPPEALGDFATGKILGLPYLAIATIMLAAIMHVVLRRTVYGQSVLAIGQNARAARLAGINVNRVRYLTYTLCAVFSAICGFFLAAFSGGAALNMGEEYLLASIAVVVIGGTSVAGGFSNVPGLWGAALFMFLLVTMLNTFGLGAGPRLILTGLIIIGVILAASGRDR
ncbi:ABC transporter permease [Hoeflea poritis]|uniref:ABC transporter permease n=1 Tax=Hoeflea poritis TaxID=2993659 RepID=A0ABT4VRH7_9HYPH|nr:ABC transporter permease [Hoeflea poritis]MDA4846623.1 ABC transporter permease [Hoeflea poritis]